MEIMALLDRIEEIVSSSARVPLTGKVLLDPDEVFALLDDARQHLPEELREAQRVVLDGDRILAEARNQAEALVREAKLYAGQVANDHAITHEAGKHAQDLLDQATKQSNEMIDQAKRVAREIRLGARQYADDMLAKVEQNLSAALSAVQGGRQELKG